MLNRLYDYFGACHSWHAFFAFILLVPLCACNSSNRYSTTLMRAEHWMESDSARAMEYYCSLPDSITQFVDFNHPHTRQCLGKFYFYKAIYALTLNDIEKAEQMFGKYMETNLNAHSDDTEKRALLMRSASMLVTLEKAKGTSSDDIACQELISQMNKLHPETVCHYKETNTSSFQHPFTRNKLYLPFLIFLSFIIGSLLFYEQQLRQFALTINKRKEQQQQLNERINHLQTQMAENESEIAHLVNLNSKMQKTTNENLGLGKKIFDFIETGGHMKNISIAEEQCFVDYYAFANPDDYMHITSPFASLTLRHTTYLILSRLGHTDADIQRILFVQPSTIRNYRLRMNRNRKERQKL